MAEARAEDRTEALDARRYGALCLDLEENIRKAIAAFLADLPEDDGRRAEAHFAVPSVLAGLLIDFIASFGKDGMPVRAACVELIDAVIAANRDEIAELVRARRERQGAGTA